MVNWFKINCIEYGWFGMGLGRYFCEASGFLGYDMPRRFLSKLLRAIRENTEEWLYMMDEPGARMLHIYLKDGQVHFAEYRLSVESYELRNAEDEAAQRDQCGECYFDMDVDIQSAVDGIVTEFSLYENGNGRKLYEEHWGAFPQKEFDQLKEYAGKLDGLFCATFLSPKR